MGTMDIIYLATRGEWRSWLEKNHGTKRSVWFTYYKKRTGKPSVPYDDAVEEAICYGWIDSTVKSVDEEKYIQKFTQRNKKSQWSTLNIARAEKMIKEGRMAEAGLAKYRERAADNNKSWM